MTFARTRIEDPLLIVHGADGRELLVVRLSADGQAGEIILNAPSACMTIRIPELRPAFNVSGAPPPPATPGAQAWAGFVIA